MHVFVRSTRLATAGVMLAFLLALAACGGGATGPAATGSSSAPPTSGAAAVSEEHNDADIRFAQGMVPHHRQAIEMAELATGRAASPEVTALAAQIKSAQDPEIEQLLGFLRTWGAELPAEGGQHGGAAGHSGAGMMSPEQLDELGRASGAAFDRLFLEQMIGHHQGAVADSQRELAEGVNPQAKQLASSIVASQSAEITRMQQLLQTV